MAKTITGGVNIAGSLHSIADDGIVVYTGDVYDPNLKMTQSEINSLEGGISGEYAWQAVTLEKYQLMQHKPKIIYFIVDTDTVDESSNISNNTLFFVGSLTNNTITTNGTIDENNLILN